MPFGQFVIGPPGSGKTTYCNGMQQFLTALGRKVAVVNLDPANDDVPYNCVLDIQDLVTLAEVMDTLELGPNGGLVYCMEHLEKNIDWLLEKLDDFKDHYILFDCPGQAELYTHHTAMQTLVKTLSDMDYRLCAVHLVDAQYCTDGPTFISVLMLSLATMLQLELPHVNVLSKIDLLRQYGDIPFNLDFFTDVLDLERLVEMIRTDDSCFGERWTKLNGVISEIITDYSLVSFCTLNIEDKESVAGVMRAIDKANGYVFGGLEERENTSIIATAATEWDWDAERVGAVQEKYIDND